MKSLSGSLRSLNELEHLIDTITKAGNSQGSFIISNQHACNLVSSSIGSILNKLRQMGKNCYFCKKDVVAAKIQNLMLKLTFLILEKEKSHLKSNREALSVIFNNINVSK